METSVYSVAGNIDVKTVESLTEELFAARFTRLKSAPHKEFCAAPLRHLKKIKKTEQTHVGICMPAVNMTDSRRDALSVANIVLGGGMSSRLFQRIREDLGLCYTVYSYMSCYRDVGVTEIYAGVNTDSRDVAVGAITEEVLKFADGGITEREFLRGKEQLKSSLILGQESVSSQMQLYGRYALMNGELFDFKERIRKIDRMTQKDVACVIKEFFDIDKASSATVGPKRSALTLRQNG